ncbi:MAG: hypothetical protein AAGD06_22515 [Acidobacteriota bacterium]
MAAHGGGGRGVTGPALELAELLTEVGARVTVSAHCVSGLVGRDDCRCWRCRGVDAADEDPSWAETARRISRAFRSGVALGRCNKRPGRANEEEEMSKLTTKDLAEQLDGSEYPLRPPADEVQAWRDAGLIVMLGYSDDYIILHGAISWQLGAYDGTEFRISRHGMLPAPEQVDADNAEAWVKGKACSVLIKAQWCEDAGYSWTFDIPVEHDTFDIIEDGETFCRGAVLDLEALPEPPGLDLQAILDRLSYAADELQEVQRQVSEAYGVPL